MKAKIHPKYNTTTFRCACGATFEIGSTLGKEYKLELCSQCHPLYTGKEKLVDTEGRIERFKRKYRKVSAK